MTRLFATALCSAALGLSSATAAPPPRDAGPQRFVAPPPRTPLYPEPAPTVDETPVATPRPRSAAPVRKAVPESTAPPPAAKPATGQPQPGTTAGSTDKENRARPAPPARTSAKPPAPVADRKAARTRTTAPARKAAEAGRASIARQTPRPSPVVSGENDASRLSAAPAAMRVETLDPFPARRGLAARHYPASNENRIDLFKPYLQDLGGGYMGVGTDQNLTFIAWARSTHAWLFDFDPVSVGINRIHVYFLQRARSYADFRRLWSGTERASSLALLRAHFKDDAQFKDIQRAFTVAHGKWSPVPARLRELDSFSKRFGLTSFHNDPGDYAYLRDLALAGRIQVLPGDLRGTRSIKGINAAALRLGVPIRVIYTSNAEDYFKTFPMSFRANMIDVPGDARSVIVRTASRRNYIYGQPPGEKFPKKAPFHYNVQTLDSLKAWFQLPRPLSITSLLDARRPVRQGFSVLDTAPSKKRAGQRQEARPQAKPAPAAQPAPPASGTPTSPAPAGRPTGSAVPSGTSPR